MALYGALAENTRRNERVERGTITVTGSATIGFTSTQTVNLTPFAGAVGGMRQITHFQLTIDNSGGLIVTGDTVLDPCLVTGSLDATKTILTVQVWKFHGTSDPRFDVSAVATPIRFQVWGNISAGQGF